MRVAEDIRVEPREEEILRLLGRGRTARDPGVWTRDLVREALADSAGLAKPRGIYDFFDRKDIPDNPVFASAVRVGLCVCTIGPDLEERVSVLMKEGQLAQGVVLDAVGSELAEAAARVLDRDMEAEEAGGELLAGARFSPGYGQWKLGGQEWLFDVLDARRIGVELSPSMMMRPRKSVSFAINFGPDPNPPRCMTPCDQCGMEDCPFRREESA